MLVKDKVIDGYVLTSATPVGLAHQSASRAGGPPADAAASRPQPAIAPPSSRARQVSQTIHRTCTDDQPGRDPDVGVRWRSRRFTRAV